MDILTESLVLLWRQLLQRSQTDINQRQPEFPWQLFGELVQLCCDLIDRRVGFSSQSLELLLAAGEVSVKQQGIDHRPGSKGLVSRLVKGDGQRFEQVMRPGKLCWCRPPDRLEGLLGRG